MRYVVSTALLLVLSIFQGAIHAAPPDNVFMAVSSRELTALAAMVEQGADVNATNESGQTPLMVAALKEGNEKLIELLVHQGADIRARDKNGMTALMHAAAKGAQENAEQLLQLGIDPDIKDNHGKTVIDYAKAGGLNNDFGNRPSFGSMLAGKNFKSDTPAYTFYITYKPGTVTSTNFEQAALRALTRKGWGISEVTKTGAQVFYARPKVSRLYKAEVIVEPSRIAIRYRHGFGFHGDRSYLEAIRTALMHEFNLY